METFLNSSKPLHHTFVEGQNHGPKKAILNIVCNVTYYLELHNAIIIFCISHFFASKGAIGCLYIIEH